MKRIFSSILIIAMSSLLVMNTTSAEEIQYGSCEMTINSSVNDWYNKAKATGDCNGLVEGYYQADQDMFNIFGMTTAEVRYNGQVFEIATPRGKYPQAWLTVYIVKEEKKPNPKSELEKPKDKPKDKAKEEPKEELKKSEKKPEKPKNQLKKEKEQNKQEQSNKTIGTNKDKSQNQSKQNQSHQVQNEDKDQIEEQEEVEDGEDLTQKVEHDYTNMQFKPVHDDFYDWEQLKDSKIVKSEPEEGKPAERNTEEKDLNIDPKKTSNLKIAVWAIISIAVFGGLVLFLRIKRRVD